MKAETEEGTVLAWSDGWHHYCIDGSGYVPNCSSTKNDKYMRVNTREALNSEERAILFWAMLSFMAVYRSDPAAAGKIALINQKAEEVGLKKIERGVSEQDLKAVIHSPAVRAKYDWLDFAVTHGEEYLKLAGLLVNSLETVSGKKIPDVLRNSTGLGYAVEVAGLDGEFVLQFDDSGKDGDFLEKVPLKMSADGITWSNEPINGWNVEKTTTQLRMTNPNTQAQSVYLKFDTSGTDYGLVSTSYDSSDECYSQALQVWKCVACSGTHATGGRVHPLEKHQRTIWMDFSDTPTAYYAILEKERRTTGEGNLAFQIYHHEEDMDADYLVQLYKYDYETGKPLEGTAFDLYERFDDKNLITKEKKGIGAIYEEEITHTPVLWDGFRLVTSVRTDSQGYASYKLEKSYHYDKTFCDGHPAPAFAVFFQGQNAEQIRTSNAQLAWEWLRCVEECEKKAEEGTHFHWKMEEVDVNAIQSIANSGQAVTVGPTESADAKISYEKSGCKADCEETYKAFISMHYSYTFVETIAREGYVLHGQHTDDVPIEIITTDSSQNGANAEFGGGYSHEISSQGWILQTQKEKGKEEIEKTLNSDESKSDVVDYYVEEICTQQIDTIEKELVEYDHSNIKGTSQNIHEIQKGTLSDANDIKSKNLATVSDIKKIRKQLTNDGQFGDIVKGEKNSQIFVDAYRQAFMFASKGDMVEKGPSNLYSHGGGTDGKEDAWRIYDHRTEGQIHINKRDMELQNLEKEGYSSYGDTQGDATLEGAVYGLFAGEDLIHPDGVTGVIFQADNLVAIASTDKEGNASFLAITEAPGHIYDYKTGSVIATENGWASAALKNLYIDTLEIDDYEVNGEGNNYVRRYRDYETENGNCWIGRPLLLGNYYVKELSRSEGYELSVNGRNNQESNYGADLEVNLGNIQESDSNTKGSVAMTRAPYVEQQSSGEEADTMPNVINFMITSQGTKEKGYDIIVSQFPEGSKLFRKDTTESETKTEVNTGQKEKKLLFDSNGQPIYQIADVDNTYPKRNEDGSFQTKEVAVSKVVSSMGKASLLTINEAVVKEILESGSDEGGDDWKKNAEELALNGKEEEQFLYVKMKVEMALRANEFETPKKREKDQDSNEETSQTESDNETSWSEYSNMIEGVYNRGVRQGEIDYEGLSGVTPGSPATDTIYGHPIVSVEISKIRQDGNPVTVGDAIVSLVDFYGENPWYSFGGIDGYKETEDSWQFQLYAGVIGSPEDFIVLEKKEEDSTIFHRIPWIPEDKKNCPRWIYIAYSNVPGKEAFGTYKDFQSWQTLGIYQCSAVLVSDAVAQGDGSIRSKTIKQNLYYNKGDILIGQDGKAMQAYEWVDITATVTQTQEVSCWEEMILEESDKYLISHAKGQYIDSYGNEKTDKDISLETVYKLVLPQVMITLTQEDIEQLPSDSGYRVGDEMGAGDYALTILGAQIQVSLDYNNQVTAGGNLYIQPVSLVYPGQEYVFQDGNGKPGEGTQKNPIGVQQRVIRQPVKVTKSIQDMESQEGKKAMANFRFKVYLKSNLERIYRDAQGTILWITQEGEPIDPNNIRQTYPALVPKFYTKMAELLSTDMSESSVGNGLMKDKVTDTEIEDFDNLNIGSEYRPVLEIATKANADSSIKREYNYKKFFDAIWVANQDKWKLESLESKESSSHKAEENTAVSDYVRQFAIDWYLETEVEKLLHSKKETQPEDIENTTGIENEQKIENKTVELAYSDQLYDQSLREAIKKAEDYLKPFFTYNLDNIYAIEWDCQENGGADYDKTTLSADIQEDGWCYGISVSLPYGTYVIVEQQPMYEQLGDFKNRHYRIEDPKEITLPAIYGGYEETRNMPEEMSSYYQYHKEDSSEDLQRKFHIWFKGENQAIKAHNYQGDFEVYRYHFVPKTEDGTAIIGSTKAFENRYCHALVPWSMTIPEKELSDMEPMDSGESSYRGFAYSKFVDIPYKSILRIEKLDSETQENLLHDQAIFRLYKAQREESEYRTGEAKFYEEEIRITGSKEFLEGMGASNISKDSEGAAGQGDIYSGLISAGIPICREEDQIIMQDESGKKIGEFKSYTTARDGLMESADKSKLFYGEQNTGYLEMPQALEAGTYILIEVKPPAGYNRTKPVVLEVYSDKVAYYREENHKVLASLFRQVKELTQNRKDIQEKEDLARIYIENTPITIRIEKRKKTYDTITYKINGRIDGSLAEIGGNPAYEYAYSQGQYLGYAWKKGTLEYLKAQKDAGVEVEIVYHKDIFAGYGYMTTTFKTTKSQNPYVPGATMTLYEGLEVKPSGKKGDYGYEGLEVERDITGAVTRMYIKEGYSGSSIEFKLENAQRLTQNGTQAQKVMLHTQKLAENQREALQKQMDSQKTKENQKTEEKKKVLQRLIDKKKAINNQESVSHKLTETQKIDGQKEALEIVTDNSFQRQNIVEENSEILEGIWNAVTVNRPDTDILYYDLGDLDIFTEDKITGVLYGYDFRHNLVDLQQLEEDRRNIQRTDREHSIFAFKDSRPYLEITGGDFTKMSYQSYEKSLTVPDEAKIYHIDQNGNRDAQINPNTGMAFVEEEITGKIYVWPVTVVTDDLGCKIGMDKIATFRIATIGEYQSNELKGESQETISEIPQDTGYLTGTWKSENGEQSHEMSVIHQNSDKEEIPDDIISYENNGRFEKYVQPILNRYGLPEYYSLSDETYNSQISLYDNKGNPVREKKSDLLKAFQKASGISDSDKSLENQKPVIYHRFGENYILENTWITGERTPNDPFHTVMSEGQADLLKRIPAGIYIMEEIKTPAGYVKGFPVGITIEETENLQTAMMEDDQTKLLVRKLDDTKEYNYKILDMGSLDSSGNYLEIGNLSESKGSFTHKQMAGVKLALYETEKQEDNSDKIKKGRQIAVWETKEEPWYLEGLAKGAYVLEELETPDGFIPSQPLTIEVNGTEQVQVADIFNDHTKIEFEKYTMDGTKKLLVDGAGFTLYEATADDNGQIVYQNGFPQYYKDKIIDTWVSSDRTIYQGFISAFETMYRNYGTSGKTVSWKENGQSYEANYVSHQQIDASVSGGESSLFPTNAELLFCMTGGQEIRIIVYQEQDNRQGRDFIFEYQFDYKKLPQINDYAVSYMTVDGIRRFDYLPAGKSFVLVETAPPEGYTAAKNQLITVKETAQIQRYQIQNQKPVLFISKCTKNGKDPQEKIIELKGAHLALYRAGDHGELIQEPNYLAAEWISGSDGIYTELEQNNGQIPEGYQKGDRKPHELRQLPDGVYYLVELKSPDYYTVMEPVKFIYSQEEQIKIIRAWNEPVKGELEIYKTDENGNLITGAVFELIAYEASDFRRPIFQKKLSDQGGRVYITDLPIGKMEEDGEILPYQYWLKEIVPPRGYAADLQVHKFQLELNQQEANLAEETQTKKRLQVINKKTRITIRKKDFNSPEEWVPGAELAVYHATGRNSMGEYFYDEQSPEAVWITEEGKDYILEGLIAGETYLLIERKAPNGFEQMKPYVFTLSADGRRICSISGQIGILTVHSYEGTDTIRSLEIQGRYGSRVEMEVRDETGQMIASWTAGGDGHTLRKEDGIEDKRLYRFIETTIYSDGSREITGCITRRAHLTEKGDWNIPDRSIENVQLSLGYEEGEEIASWIPSQETPRIEIDNPIMPENLKITIGNQKQNTIGIEEARRSIDAAEVIWVTITCTNTTHSQEDMVLTIRTEDKAVILESGGGKLKDGQLEYLLEEMKPGEKRQVQYAFQLETDVEKVSVSAISQCMGEKIENQKTVPVLWPNHLTVFYEVTGNRKELEDGQHQVQVFLYTEQGEELKGSYHYKGSKEGSLRSGDILELADNEYITINPGPIYKNIKYKVTDIQEGRTLQGQVGEIGASAFFSKEITDKTEGTIFQKGQQYQLKEITLYSDGSSRESHKLRFLLDNQISIQGMDVLNQRQKVLLSKREITGEKELEGALLQVRKKDGTILEEWISSKEPHLLETVLIPGECYILHEEAAPDGYGYEEDILFQVEEGEYVNQVIMEDQNTTIVVSKKELTGEEEISGAKLQILDEEKNVVEEWISSTTPHRIIGKLQAGKNYILHEEQAPDGYGYAEDCLFTVPIDGRIEIVEMRDAPTYVEVSKTDITGERELPGAKLKVIDKKGTIVCQWVSTDEPYKLVGILKAGETYLLQEEAAPEGYAYASNIEFTVSKDGSIDQVIMKDEVTRVEVLKVDSETDIRLAGAQLELITEDGILVEAWTSTESPHIIEGKLQAGKNYILREKAAPLGYRRLEQDMWITVPKEPQTITIKLKNQKKIPVSKNTTITKVKEKKREEKDAKETNETKEIKETEKIGKVHTDYWSAFSAHGGASYQAFTNLGLPKLGDNSQNQGILPWLIGVFGVIASKDSENSGKYMIGGILCLLAVIGALLRKRKWGRLLLVLCLGGIFGVFMVTSAHAETIEVKPDGQIVVTGDIYKEVDQLPEVLPEIFYYGDLEYERQSYQIITAMTEAGTKEVEEEIIYEEVEQIDTLPETTKILVTDQRYQTEYEQEFPIIDVKFSNWRWIEGFELPLVVEEADAQTYELNGLQVPAQEEAPFSGYEEELLKLAEINPSYYRITKVKWNGEPWIGEDQKVYRNAIAEGEKYVADCQAVYGGIAVLEPVNGVAWQAVYQKVKETKKEVLEESELEQSQESESFRLGEPSEVEGNIAWYETHLGQTVISVGLLVICLPLMMIFIKKKKQSR